MDSEGHYRWQDASVDHGGPWYQHLTRKIFSPTQELHLVQNKLSRFDGRVIADIVPGPPLNVGVNAERFGAESYNRMKPTQPDFNALNAIYELREVPGMLRQRFHKNGLKNIGSYYLALKFGWEPLLNDVRSFVQTHIKSNKRLKQLMRDNGRPVRRNITLRSSGETDYGETVPAYNIFPSLHTDYIVRMTHRVDMVRNSRVWASARFRYHLPPGNTESYWTRMMMARIFGFAPSPSVVYNAIPWSWLVDWFSNLGDVIENLDAGVADRLAADYFYVMEENITSSVVTADYIFRSPFEDREMSATAFSSHSAIQKHRARGDPFGFRTDFESLKPAQMAILGALGLSRLR